MRPECGVRRAPFPNDRIVARQTVSGQADGAPSGSRTMASRGAGALGDEALQGEAEEVLAVDMVEGRP